MHKSRLAGFIIDCKTDDLESAAVFWSAALGYPQKTSNDPVDVNYKLLKTPDDEVHIEVQQVEHDSRVHLDIETDNIEAEVARLEKLGATVVKQVRTWCVMQAPTGQKFCVVSAVRSDFEKKANEWK